MSLKKRIMGNPGKFKILFTLYNRIPLIGKNRIKVKKGNNISLKAARLKNTNITVKGKGNTVIIGDFCVLSNCSVYIAGNDNTICLGEKSAFTGADFYIEDDRNEICVGAHTSVHGNADFSAIEGTRIVIGEDCMFSKNVHLRTGDSHAINDLDGNRINPSGDIIIGDHVWFGMGVICLKGVTVPGGCVAGAGTTISKSLSEGNSVYAGVPAKQIRTDIHWTRAR
ncbi:MAG TPA: hypothetical protein DEQ02_09205 [Ruminococcaceae bacterium]|nr:hypothetical protein [Oscillospiraceae bacterium]